MVKTPYLPPPPHQIVKRAGTADGIGRAAGIKNYAVMKRLGTEISLNARLFEPSEHIFAVTPVFKPLEIPAKAMADRIVPFPNNNPSACPGEDNRTCQTRNTGSGNNNGIFFQVRILDYDKGWSAGGQGREPSPLNIIQTR